MYSMTLPTLTLERAIPSSPTVSFHLQNAPLTGGAPKWEGERSDVTTDRDKRSSQRDGG